MSTLPLAPNGFLETYCQPDLSAYRRARRGQPPKDEPLPETLRPAEVSSRVLTHGLLMIVAEMERQSGQHHRVIGGRAVEWEPIFSRRPFWEEEVDMPPAILEAMLIPEFCEIARTARQRGARRWRAAGKSGGGASGRWNRGWSGWPRLGRRT